MHDIKYFFSIKIIKQFREGQKKFPGGDKLLESTIFQNPGETRAPEQYWIRPWF
jgi:hypothetical protein